MNYELAKQLKEAGFPQDSANCYDDPYSCCQHSMYYRRGMGEGGGRNDEPYYPTLSELLRACPIIENTRLGVDFIEQYKWSAGYSSPDGDTYDGEYVQNCHTPEEAVALLWLKVNNKKHE